MNDKSKTWCDHFRKGRGWPNDNKRGRRSERGLNMIMQYLNDTLLKYFFHVLVYTNYSERTGYILLLLYLLHKICGQVFCRGDTYGFRLREVLDNKPGKVHHLVGFGCSNPSVIGTQTVYF